MESSVQYLRVALFYAKDNCVWYQFDGDKAFYYGIKNKTLFRLVAIAVRSEYQKQGIATKLINSLIAKCSECGLEKITLRTHIGGNAYLFWQHHGARVTCTKGEDYEMEIKLKEPSIKTGYNSPRWTNEIADCSLPVTFDTYSNCSFGCLYCFSQFQRGIGPGKENYFNKQVASVNPDKIRKIFTLEEESQFSNWIRAKRPIQWGGLSDQFDGYERKYGVTLELMQMFREMNYPICFSTKSAWVFHDTRYIKLFEGADNWNMKFSIITLDEQIAKKIEVGVPTPKARLEAMKIYSQLNKGGATLRLRPFILGASSKDYEDLIVAAHDAGATAVSTEFFCMESRGSHNKINYNLISECIGFDIYEFYRKYTNGSGYMRLNRHIKEKYFKRMDELCRKLNMRFYVSDAHYKEACTSSCCCGLPDNDPRFNYSRGNFSYALQLCKKNGKVTFAEIEADMKHLDFPWWRAEGYNTRSSEAKAKFRYLSMKDYLRYIWNSPYNGQSPYTMFGGVMKPNGKDANGDIIYVYDSTKTFISPCETCGGCGGR